MAAVTFTWATALNNAVVFEITYDSQTGDVSLVTVTNDLTEPVEVRIANRTLTFQPGVTQQDVSAFGVNVTKTANFFPITKAPAV